MLTHPLSRKRIINPHAGTPNRRKGSRMRTNVHYSMHDPQTDLKKKKTGSMSKKLARQAKIEQSKRLDASKPKPTGKMVPSVIKVKSKIKKATKAEIKMKMSTPGRLKDIAIRVVMKACYGTRRCGWAWNKAVIDLSKCFNCWDKVNDKMLHRLMCHINSSLDMRSFGFVGDKMDDLVLTVCSDADYAGDKVDMLHTKSTSGGFVAVTGPNTFFPLACYSKQQGSTATSTPEAELTAMRDVFRNQALPIIDLLEFISNGRKWEVMFPADNQTAAGLVKTG